jgi:hypothetical protein
MGIVERINDERIDELEKFMVDNYPALECNLEHIFTPGLYGREITMPTNAGITSEIHLTCHQFNISKGKVAVKIDKEEWEIFEAPYKGITRPGTRRVLVIAEECVWTTYHPIPYVTGDENDLSEDEKQKVVDRIESEILEDYYNPLIGGRLKRNKVTYKLNDNEEQAILKH